MKGLIFIFIFSLYQKVLCWNFDLELDIISHFKVKSVIFHATYLKRNQASQHKFSEILSKEGVFWNFFGDPQCNLIHSHKDMNFIPLDERNWKNIEHCIQHRNIKRKETWVLVNNGSMILEYALNLFEKFELDLDDQIILVVGDQTKFLYEIYKIGKFMSISSNLIGKWTSLKGLEVTKINLWFRRRDLKVFCTKVFLKRFRCSAGSIFVMQVSSSNALLMTN